MDKRYRILTVDDEPVNIHLIKSALREEYDILSSLSGHDAIDLLEKHKPDLILLDVVMPDITGFEVCKIIKADERFADIPVIFLTAMGTNDAELQGLELGGIDYIAKPVKIALLKLRIRNHLALKEQRDLLKQKNEDLEAALTRIKRLEGIILICSYCKKIRDDKSTWNRLEQYIADHSEAVFSHGMCPECAVEQMKVIDNMFAKKC